MIEPNAPVAPFDVLAPTYDADFTYSPIARHLRERVQSRLSACFPAGASVLELGCGTGEDARFLAARGVRVLATDSSAAMLEQAEAKAAGMPLVTFAPLDLRDLPARNARFETVFDGVYSNFGVLNCIGAWDGLAQWLAARVRSGGRLVLVVISPRCLWEVVWHGAHGDFSTAFRRWRGGAAFQLPGAQSAINIFYPTIGEFERAFLPYFRRTRLKPLGVFLPPTDVYGVVEKRPRLLRLLTRLDDRIGRAPGLAAIADHFLIEFTRNAP